MTAKLNVNIDHVATVRQARKTIEPSVVAAALACEQAGADGITVHLRGDRRHIQDRDVELLRASVTTYLNLEMTASDEMVAIALRIKPDAVSLVPENPQEITTEGGLDVVTHFDTIRYAIGNLTQAGIFVSIFVDPVPEQVRASAEAGAQQVELCTAEYAELTLGSRASHSEGMSRAAADVDRIRESAVLANDLGLVTAAGHGLTFRNVGALSGVPQIAEFNIGHSIISRSIFVGLGTAVREMLAAIREGSKGY